MLSHLLSLVQRGTSAGFYSSQSIGDISSLSDQLVGHISGLGHLGDVEQQVDVVTLVRDS
jgi:hypothetical protein